MAVSTPWSSDEGIDEPQRWLGSSSLLDLEDPKLRLRVRSLVQLCKNDREKALAVYGYVKRLPLARRVKVRPATAREVYDAGRGDAPDKATLLVAMLRIARLPARIRVVLLSGEILRGIAPGARVAYRPVVEIWLQDRWIRTDTYIFDAACMAAARQRLKDRGWEWGYGIHVNGRMLWDGFEDAFLGGVPTECDLMVTGDLGVFNDVGHLHASGAFRRGIPLLESLRWLLITPLADWALRNLRKEVVRPIPHTSRFN
ncbi:MAG: transglutaminase domain-containing protein [Burkholderiales bacterium]|nr:transglutaminase domain-containing protein [Burkholderiales bacterium]